YSITSGSPKTWKRLDSSQWIAFKDATGLNIYGSGIIDGQGIRSWDQSCRYHPNQLTIESLTFCYELQAKHGERILYGLDGINEGNDIPN
ncbi:polygalacturonase QRT2-like protein, partial [Tanacetum coccineum]